MHILLCSLLLVQLVSVTVSTEVQCGITKYDTIPGINGGMDARPLEFPWQISLQVKQIFSYTHNCGGSLINDQWVLTAAHCVDPKMNGVLTMAVVTGAHQLSVKSGLEESFPIDNSDVHIHPYWDPYTTMNNDYALIKLPQKLDYLETHSHLRPVCLAGPEDSKTFDNMTCVISGWGNTEPFGTPADILQKLDVKVWTHEKCFASWIKGGMQGGGLRVQKQMICLTGIQGEGHGACHGDSGGPLQCRINGQYILAGATSFGKYCGAVDPPAIYARISAERAWIDGIIQKYS